MKRLLLFTFLGTVLTFQSPTSALACSCMLPQSLQQSIEDTDVIFMGTVDDIRTDGLWGLSVSMTVSQDWKGLKTDEKEELTLATSNDSASCGYAFTEGEEYLVYASRNEETGKLGAYLCSETKLKAHAENDLALLSSMAASCSPYRCKDGTEVARCSEDGHVINYFAAPCLTHGGEIEVGFSDVAPSHANAEAIAYVQAQGIVEGYNDGSFKPDVTINRAEFVKILMGALEQEDGTVCRIAAFPDASMSEWYGPSVHKARCQGIVEGYADGTFKPANTINFAEAAKILTKAFGLEATTTIPACEGACPWYRSPVLMLEMKAAIPTTIVRFDQNITRGEMAEMIFRLKANNNDKPATSYEDLK